jgi:nitrous-oxide reductase
MKMNFRYRILTMVVVFVGLVVWQGCKPKAPASVAMGDAASKAYVAPGKYDEFYNFVSGGFNGQMNVYGIPSGRLFRIIPVFSEDPTSGYGYSEETKPMLNTSHGYIPWDDLHHPALSTTNGEHDGRWVFGNANNTPRVARIDLKTFRTAEIIELPNSGGNHSSPFITENTEYVVAGTRFSVPVGDKTDVPISTFKENFKGFISFISVDKNDGKMKIAFQLKTPGVSFDLARAGKGPSHGWFFFSCYNTEQAYTLLEINASQKDKDFIMAVNWKKAEEYIAAGKGEKVKAKYAHNWYDESTHTATSEMLNEVLQLDPAVLKDIIYFIPCPKSPHGCDTDPTGMVVALAARLLTTSPIKKMLLFILCGT